MIHQRTAELTVGRRLSWHTPPAILTVQQTGHIWIVTLQPSFHRHQCLNVSAKIQVSFVNHPIYKGATFKPSPDYDMIAIDPLWITMMSSAVLCCAVLRYAVMCYAVLCCAVLCCVVLCCAVFCCAVLCCAVLFCSAVLFCALLCYVLLCSAMFCCALLCSAVLCCAVLCVFDRQKECLRSVEIEINDRYNDINSQWDICMMTSFDYKYQNALRQVIVFSIFSFVKNPSCVTQICITRIVAKCILADEVKWRHHANGLLESLNFMVQENTAQAQSIMVNHKW